MSTSVIQTQPQPQHAGSSLSETWQSIREHVLRPLGSMRITVVLLLVSLFLVFAGSLAQARRDVWMVVGEYFRCWVAWIQIKDLFPPSMFPDLIGYDWNKLGWLQAIPYPGGWTIGTIMCVNLVAAHMYRIRIQAKGARLKAGLVAAVLATAVTVVIIEAGNAAGLQSEPMLGYDAVWTMMLGALGVITLAAAAQTFGPYSTPGPSRWVWGSVALITGSTLIYFLVVPDARLSHESMRILWQLLEGSVAASAMLIAGVLLFGKRGGVVVLHLGILMLMFSEWQVAMYGRENQMTLTEGETATFLRDIRERELAIIERGAVSKDGQKHDRVWAIPEATLRAAAETGEIIRDDSLPFHIRVRKYFVNSELQPLDSNADVPEAEGLGKTVMAVEQPRRTGMDELPDISSCYIDLIDPVTGETMTTRLVSQEASELRGEFAERVDVAGRQFDLFLRSMRTYRPWTVKLIDVSRTNYIGTTTPKDFRSRFIITEPDGTEHEFVTWMNNPVRFGGETFYQQGYQNIPGTGEVTTLQVVRNTGWMLPYIGCMVVAFGMFAQFGQTLVRFLARQSRQPAETTSGSHPLLKAKGAADSQTQPKPQVSEQVPAGPAQKTREGIWAVIVPAVITVTMAGWIAGKASPRKTPPEAPDIQQFAATPITSGGRMQPFGSFAQNTLLSILGKTTFRGELEQPELDRVRPRIIERLQRVWPKTDWTSMSSFSGTHPEWIAAISEKAEAEPDEVDEMLRDVMTTKRTATRWMLDVITRPDVAERHRVFHITDDQLLALLNLKKRSPHFEYSLADFRDKLPDLQDIYAEAHQLLVEEQAARLTPLQRRVHTLMDDEGRLRFYQQVFNGRPDDEDQSFSVLVEAWRLLKLLESRPAPMSVPTGSDKEELAWETGVAADALVNAQRVLDRLQISSPEDAVPKLLKAMPRESVAETARLTWRMLQDRVRQTNPGLSEKEVAAAIKAQAADAKDAAPLQNEPYLQKIMALIAEAADEKDIDSVIAELPDDRFAELTSDRPAPGALSVLEILEQLKDHRSNELRSKLRQEMTSGADLNRALEKATAELVISDLNKRAGHVLFVENRSESVLAQAFSQLQAALSAWQQQDIKAFNETTSGYHSWLKQLDVRFLNDRVYVLGLLPVHKVDYENYVNSFAPQYYTIFLYLTALILTFFSWIGFRTVLWRSAMGVTAVAIVVHAFYLYARMQISGRPPVTNLYSTAVFIGLGIVIGAYIFEFISRMGLLNAVGTAVGAATLCMAWFLGIDEGDTLSVMQAVLDTQFWLATHVVIINIGYAATILAGLLGVIYCVQHGPEKFSVASRIAIGSLTCSVATAFAGYGAWPGLIVGAIGAAAYTYYVRAFRKPNVPVATSAEFLGKVIYGVICFALFFSFVGTVLGGLWADDSWGRFWGWDPKENGALMIVIWNALILHARWDKMVRDYGTAVLAIAGNIVTAWSWFGVNELGAGLHKYGFTEGRLMYLAWFVAANAAFMIAAWLFRPRRKQQPAA